MKTMRRFLPLVLLTTFVFLFFLRLFYPTLSIFMIPDFGESDVLHLNLPFKYILSASLKNHEWPLWSPYLANGFPILSEGQIGTFYLPNLLLFRFLPLIWAYNLNLVIAYLIAATGTYLFTRKVGLTRISAFFAAFIFTFSGFMSVHLNHFNLIQTASLLPLVFWSSLILWKDPKLKYCLLLSFFFSEQIFAGHFYIVFITLIGVAIFLMCLLTLSGDWNLTGAKKMSLFLFSLFIAFFLSAIQLFPTIELWQLSGRAGGLDFNTITQYPYPFKHLITFVLPYFFGSPANGTYPAFSASWGIFWENTAYIGIIPLILAAVSIFFLKNKLVKTFFVIFFTSLFLVLGKNSPFYFIFSFFPFNLFRVPSKFLLLTTFALSILAVLTIEKILKKARGSNLKIVPILVISSIFISLIVDEYNFSYHYPPKTEASIWIEPPEITKLIKSDEDRISSFTASYSWNNVFKKAGWKDFSPYVFFKNSLYPNLNALFSISQTGINTGGLIPRRLSAFISATEKISVSEEEKESSISAQAKNALLISGVNYVISPLQIKNAALTSFTTLIPPDNLQIEPFYLYKLKSLPRSYIAYNGQKIDTVEEFYKQLENESFVAENRILVENDDLSLFNPGKTIEKVNIASATPTQIILTANSEIPGVLVVTDTNYPGWKAYLDDTPVKIYNVNLIQRGIYFPAGNHQVKFLFQPDSFELGKKITFYSWVIISLAVFLSVSVFPRKFSGSRKPFFHPGNRDDNLMT